MVGFLLGGAAALAGGALLGRSGEMDASLEVRLRMPMRHLSATVVEPTYVGKYLPPWEKPPWATTPGGTVLIPSTANPLLLEPMMRRTQRDGGRVVIDSDANLFAADAKHFVSVMLFQMSWGPMTASEAATWQSKYASMIRAADAVTVASPALADVYCDSGAKEVFVVSNSIDPTQWESTIPIRPDVFAIGYAGGPGHEDSLELIRPALQWASAQDVQEDLHVVLYGIGRAPAGWNFPYALAPYTPSYAEYRGTLTEQFDVGLMPLTDTPYNRGRSDLKLMEYAMAGALPIVQDMPNYAEWRDTPVLFARDADEFTEHVQWAATHRDEVRERADAVREIVLRTRTISHTIERWRAAVAPAGGVPTESQAAARY